MKKFILSGIALAALCSTGLNAQNSARVDDNFRTWAVGVDMGATVSLMDLTYNFDRQDGLKDGTSGIKWGAGIHATKMFTNVFGARGSYHHYRTGGSQNGDRYLSFAGSVNSFDLEGVISVLNLGNTRSGASDMDFALLVTGGVAGVLVNAQAYNREVPNTSGKQENTVGVAIPLGLIAKFRVDRFDIDGGLKYLHFLYDKAEGLSARGTGNDGMAYPFVGLTYNIGKNKQLRSAVYTNPFGAVQRDITDVRNKMDGLANDDDGDGVTNLMDKDANTAAGVAVDGSGRPMDVDGDGIPDYMDSDPFTRKGAKTDAQGREVDTDGDGVPDGIDAEANTPKGTLVNFKGQTIPKGGGGGSVMPAVGSGFNNMYFALNSATVSAEDHRNLAMLARGLQLNKDLKIKLIGYTDKTGSESYNQKLGLRRAEAIKRELVNTYGVDAGRITAESGGATEFISNNRNDINRRVEVLPN